MTIPDLLGMTLDLLGGACLGGFVLAWTKWNMRRGLHRLPRLHLGQRVLVLEEGEHAKVVDVEPCGRIWVRFEGDFEVVAWYAEGDLEVAESRDATAKSKIHVKEVALQ